jgi:hypothetical protein
MNAIIGDLNKDYTCIEQDHDASDDPDDESLIPSQATASVFRNTPWEPSDENDETTPDHESETVKTNDLQRNGNPPLRVSSSFEMDDDDWDVDDETSLRRYNLDFKAEIPSNFRPAEFDSLPTRLCK